MDPGSLTEPHLAPATADIPLDALAGRHTLLQSLVPAMQALVTISDLGLVQAVMALIQGTIMAIVCPLLAPGAHGFPDQSTAALSTAAGRQRIQTSPIARLLSHHFDLRSGTSNAGDISLASAKDPGLPTLGELNSNTVACSFLGSIAHLQLVGLEASGHLLHVLLPIIACFQVTPRSHF